jgi:hypothetical protein
MAVKLIFVHIPKTGGQSVGKFLNSIGKVCNPYSLLGRRPESSNELFDNLDGLKEEWKKAMRNVPDDVDFLQDLMHVNLFDGLYPGVPRVTVLREPVSRVLSAYNFYVVSKGGTETLKEFISSKERMNVQSYLTGNDLGNFSIVGNTEGLDTFIHSVADLVGYTGEVVVPKVNVGEYDFNVTKTDRRMIARRNELDISLWEKYVNMV